MPRTDRTLTRRAFTAATLAGAASPSVATSVTSSGGRSGAIGGARGRVELDVVDSIRHTATRHRGRTGRRPARREQWGTRGAAASGQVRYIEWAEEADPYAVLLADLPSSDLSKPRTIFVDNSVRKFIVDGLLHASDQAEKSSSSGVVVLSAPPAITQMRERKSKAEIQILRCVNEVSHWFCSFLFIPN